MFRDVYVWVDSQVKDSSGHSYSDGVPNNWYCVSEFKLHAVTTMETANAEKFYVDAERGTKVYVLYVIYTDGDSFGSSSGNGEVIWCFSDLELAKQAAMQWKYAADQKHQPDNVKFTTELGVCVMGVPGCCYFGNNITDVKLQQFEVDDFDFPDQTTFIDFTNGPQLCLLDS